MVDNTQDIGYLQAVDNLAFYVRELTIQTQSPIFDKHPWLIEEDSDTQMEFCRQHMSDEENAKWDKLDEAFAVIVNTYQVDPQQAFSDVFNRITLYDIEGGNLLN